MTSAASTAKVQQILRWKGGEMSASLLQYNNGTIETISEKKYGPALWDNSLFSDWYQM